MLRRTINLLKMSMMGIIAASLAFACVPVCGLVEGVPGKVLSIAVACVFWGGLILGQVFFWCANDRRKKIQQKISRAHGSQKTAIGLFTFGTSKEARLCDLVCAASLLAAIVFNFLQVRNNWLIILNLAILFLSFHFHCILNGKTYRYIKTLYLEKTQRRE